MNRREFLMAGGAGCGGSVQTEKGCVALNGYKGHAEGGRTVTLAEVMNEAGRRKTK